MQFGFGLGITYQNGLGVGVPSPPAFDETAITTPGSLTPSNLTAGDTVTVTAPITDTGTDTITLVALTSGGVDRLADLVAGDLTNIASGELVATWDITRDAETIQHTQRATATSAVTVIDSTGVRMADPNQPGAGVTVVTFELFFSVSSLASLPDNNYLINQGGAQRGFELDLNVSGNGTIDFGKMEDGTGANLTNFTNSYGDRVFRFPEGDGEVTTTIPRDKMLRLRGRIDYVAGTLVVDDGNINVYDGTFDAAAQYTQPTYAFQAFTNNLGTMGCAGMNFERFALYYNDSATPSILVEGNAATVNASPAVTHGSVSDTNAGVPQAAGAVVFASEGPGTTINGADLDFVTGSSTGLFARGRVASTAFVPYRVHGQLDVSLIPDNTVIYMRLGPQGALSAEAGAGDPDQITHEYSFTKTTGMTTHDFDLRAVGVGNDFFGITCALGVASTITVNSLSYADVPNTVNVGDAAVTVAAATSIYHHGVEKRFTKEVSVLADPEGFPIITDTNPGVGGDLEWSTTIWPAPGVSADGDDVNGSMVDAGSKAQAQSAEHGYGGNPSRFGATAIARYGATLNISPGKLARNVAFDGADLPTNCTITTAVGLNYPRSHDHLFMRFSTWHIRASAPAANVFMPAIADTTATLPGISVSDIDLSVLPSLAAPAGYSWPTLEDVQRHQQYGRVGHVDNIAGEGALAPVLTGDGYSRGLMDQRNPAMQFLISDNPSDQKLIVAKSYVAEFLEAVSRDIARATHGRDYRIAGGSAIHQGPAVIGAALVQNVVGIDDISARLLDTGPFHGYITAAFVSNTRDQSTASRPLTRFYDYHVGMPYWSQVLSAHQPDAWATNDGFGFAGSHARASYNQIAINNTAMSALLINLMSGAPALLNRPAMMDYYDRAMPEWIIRGNGVALSEEPDNFTQELWKAYRPNGEMVDTKTFALDHAALAVTADYDDPLHEPSPAREGMPKLRTVTTGASLDVAEACFGKGVYADADTPDGFSLTGAPSGVSVDSAGIITTTGAYTTAGSFDEFTVTGTRTGKSDVTVTARAVFA